MDVVYYDLLVLIGVRVHLFPSRTQKLSLLSPTIVAGRLAAKIGNANTITGLPKGGPVFYTCKRWRRPAWTDDGRSAGSCSAGGREQIGSAAGGKAEVQNKAQQACGRCFIRNAPFCFSALAENPINSILCQCCAAAGGIGNGNGGQNLRLCPSRLCSGAAFVCMCQEFFFDTRTYRFKVAP